MSPRSFNRLVRRCHFTTKYLQSTLLTSSWAPQLPHKLSNKSPHFSTIHSYHSAVTFETLQQSTSPSRGTPHRHHGPDLFRRQSVRPLQVVPQMEHPAVPFPTKGTRCDSFVGLQVAYQGVPAMIPPAASSAAVRTWGHRRRVRSAGSDRCWRCKINWVCVLPNDPVREISSGDRHLAKRT